MKNCHGTPYYIAPEVLNESYNEKCDVWSCGIILYIMLSGVPPFNEANDEEILEAVQKGKFNFDLPEFKTVSPEAKQLIREMLTYKPKNRPSIEKCLKHEWFKKNQIDQKNFKINPKVMINIKNFQTKNKIQESLYYFLVNHIISKEEKGEMIETFKALDLNKDGVISKKELKQGFKNIDNNLTDQDFELIMKRLDNNHSNFIDYTEFVVASINRKKFLSTERIKTCFKLLDQD